MRIVELLLRHRTATITKQLQIALLVFVKPETVIA
jgi:hypothetical protein